jgi:hypothetical protein
MPAARFPLANHKQDLLYFATGIGVQNRGLEWAIEYKSENRRRVPCEAIELAKFIFVIEA